MKSAPSPSGRSVIERASDFSSRASSRFSSTKRGPVELARAVAWDLHRFGLTPRKLRQRSSSRAAPPIMLVSIPKAGTHLAERILCLHPQVFRPLRPTLEESNVDDWGGFEQLAAKLKPGQLLVTHFAHSAERAKTLDRYGICTFFLHRDPRDIAASDAHFMSDNRRHRHHALFGQLESTSERVEMVVTGLRDKGLLPLAERLDRYTGWLDTRAHALSFEDLVGANGRPAHERAIGDMFAHADLVHDPSMVSDIADRSKSKASPTFRRGVSGDWSQGLSPATKSLVETELEAVTRELGYSVDSHR